MELSHIPQEEAQMRIEEEDEYHAPAGDYIPPLVPTGPTDADVAELKWWCHRELNGRSWFFRLGSVCQ